MTSKISTILRETDVPQVVGALIKFNVITQEFIGKCAMGVLACESGVKELKLNKTNLDVDWGDIMNAYDISSDPIYPSILLDGNWDWNMDSGMSDIIVRLNDQHKLTFKQIADFLETTFDL